MDKDEACRLLNLSSSASLDDIRHSYMELSRKYHPDHNSDHIAHEMFILIKKAYDYLTLNEDKIQPEVHVSSGETQIPPRPPPLIYHNLENIDIRGNPGSP